MRILVLLLLMPTAACGKQPLAGTQWVEEGQVECPDVIEFASDAYTYLNDCYALGTDGVVENGGYLVKGNNIELRERNIHAPGGYEYWPKNLTSVEIAALDEKQLVLKVGTKIVSFRRK